MFVPDGDGFVATILTQGGWDPHTANGGTVLALLGHCLEDVPTLVPMSLARFTADLHRPIPLGRRLDVEASILREGKKLQLVEQRILVDGVEHARATALRLREAEVATDELASTTDDRPADLLPPPEEATGIGSLTAQLPGFLRAVDMRRARLRDGSGVGVWLRLTEPVVAGEPLRETAWLTFGFDYANLIGLDGHPAGVTMINPDVTAHVLRRPTGGWIAITGDTRFEPAVGRGLSWATLSDADGPYAVVSISQLLQPR